MSGVLDRREEFANTPWQQGRLLLTKETARWTEVERKDTDELEHRMAFVGFFAADAGRSRQLVYVFNSTDECAEAVKSHNGSLPIGQL